MENEGGAKLHRPELFRLLADCEPRDVPLPEQVDRLSRLTCSDGLKLRAGIDAKATVVQGNITPVPQAPYGPDLDPVERIWLYLRERFLRHRLLAKLDTCCRTWNARAADPNRVRSPVAYP